MSRLRRKKRPVSPPSSLGSLQQLATARSAPSLPNLPCNRPKHRYSTKPTRIQRECNKPPPPPPVHPPPLACTPIANLSSVLPSVSFRSQTISPNCRHRSTSPIREFVSDVLRSNADSGHTSDRDAPPIRTSFDTRHKQYLGHKPFRKRRHGVLSHVFGIIGDSLNYFGELFDDGATVARRLARRAKRGLAPIWRRCLGRPRHRRPIVNKSYSSRSRVRTRHPTPISSVSREPSVGREDPKNLSANIVKDKDEIILKSVTGAHSIPASPHLPLASPPRSHYCSVCTLLDDDCSEATTSTRRSQKPGGTPPKDLRLTGSNALDTDVFRSRATVSKIGYYPNEPVDGPYSLGSHSDPPRDRPAASTESVNNYYG